MKILYTATVLSHICQFHLPHMARLQALGHTVHVAAHDNLAVKNGQQAAMMAPTEILASQSETITISGAAYPAALVKRRFEMINSLHIEFVFASLEQSASPIRNIKQYLKTTLFNATGTMNSYYDALVRHEQRRKYDWMDDLDG